MEERSSTTFQSWWVRREERSTGEKEREREREREKEREKEREREREKEREGEVTERMDLKDKKRGRRG
jgi:hypothetical protein